MNMGKVLVTGGAGFLGSQLVKRLLALSEHIYVIDDLSTGNLSSLPETDQITFIHGSITNEQILDDVIPQVDYIFHLACSNLYLSVTDLRLDFNTNLYGGFLLLDKAQRLGVRLKRFLYTSTASVYGDASVIPTPESYYQIKMPYPASKFGTEHYAQVFYHMYGLPVTTLRLSNVYGPGQLVSNPYCGVVARFFDAISNGKPIQIYGDGSQTRDFTYMEDSIEAIVRASMHPDTVGRVYNVGTGTETTVRQLAESVMACTGHKLYPMEFLPKRVVDKVYRRAVKMDAFRKDVGHLPVHTLDEGLSKTYRWIENK